MIIVEGPDGGGKSTLARRLSADLDWPIAPRVVGTDTQPMVDLKRWVEDNVEMGYHTTIYDRHRLISEPIYSSVLGRVSPGFSDYAWMFNMLQQFYDAEPIIIYCLPQKPTVIHNIRNGDDDNSAIEVYIDLIYQAYVFRSAYDVGCGQAILYDYTWESYEELRSRVEGLMHEHDR